ncbi:COX15/CtaA family protein [Geomonas sp. Red32]|uniref:COX15/CtaA family protein n=1 Tax=Geomonas sp. Red32 TaxID=2912856 RepID=UPI00202CF2C1|nr:COX15/CtaA family protein [Geomonas sp. Red32]MCM0083125.1 COX15/CtaA family protein [Geomonas sp. Red32]
MLGRVTAGLFFLLLIWGNLVAGMQAGLACPDWPLCQGKFLPPLRVDVWMEFLHRVIAALATVTLVILARQRMSSYHGFTKAIPITAVGLIALEILLGALVVGLGLPVQVTTVHFMIGLAIFMLVLFMAICDGDGAPVEMSLSGYAGALFSLLILVYAQASLGAYLRHSASGLACPDFPTCQGTLIPVVWDRPVATHFTHRVVAAATFLTVFTLYLYSLKERALKARRGTLLTLTILVAIQIGLGAATVLSGLSYPVTALHLAMTMTIIGLGLRAWLLQIRDQVEPLP